LLETLNKIGGEHGIGRIDLVENRFVGMKSRGCYETPGGTLILMARIASWKSLTLDRSTLHYKQKLALDYAEMVYNGLWFTPLREALDAFFEKTSETTTGEITLRSTKATSSRSAASRPIRSIRSTSPASPWARVTIRRTRAASSI
jgi:argininosuccinate synthase